MDRTATRVLLQALLVTLAALPTCGGRTELLENGRTLSVGPGVGTSRPSGSTERAGERSGSGGGTEESTALSGSAAPGTVDAEPDQSPTGLPSPADPDPSSRDSSAQPGADVPSGVSEASDGSIEHAPNGPVGDAGNAKDSAGLAGEGSDAGLAPTRVSLSGGYLNAQITLPASSLAISSIALWFDGVVNLWREGAHWRLFIARRLTAQVFYPYSIYLDPCEYVQIRDSRIQVRIPLAYYPDTDGHTARDVTVDVGNYDRAAGDVRQSVKVESGPLPAFDGAAFCPYAGDSVPVVGGGDYLQIVVPVQNSSTLPVSPGACALNQDGRVYCWGVLPVPPATRFVELGAARGPGMCGVDESGSMICWALGSASAVSAPAVKLRSGETVAHLAATGLCVILGSGAVRCWDDTQSIDVPGDYVSVSGSIGAGCAVTTAGSVRCWGFADWAERAPQERLSEVFPGSYVQVAVVEDVVCARTAGGQVHCASFWEDRLALEPKTFVNLSEAGKCICALESDGAPTCLGFCDFPQGMRAKQIRADAEGAARCAVRLNGGLECWDSGEPER